MFNKPFSDITGLLVLGFVLYILKDYWLVLSLMLLIVMAIEFVKLFDKNKQNIFK